MNQMATLEQDTDGWWACQKLGKDNILGHGSTEEEALQDLEYQLAGFVGFLKRTGRSVPESLK